MLIVKSLEELRETVTSWKRDGLSVGFVPTMGALHNGHISLVEMSVQRCDRTVTSIYVNPTQFAAHEDLDSYPRQEDEDQSKLKAAGCDLVFCPTTEVMYPEGEETRVDVPSLGAKLEGQFRPHFFGGVATVVCKLFNQVQPDTAFFGEKDFQQVQVIRRMVTDLAMPVEIVAGSTFRADDGLALSSRNAYLTDEERAIAPALAAALHRAAIRIRAGAAHAHALAEAVETLKINGFQKVDYIEAIDPSTLDPISTPVPEYPLRLVAAAWLGKTRLIDNIPL
tara:strand:- start:20506 stop:21348 length:843 start_codon:yes stop_codon:yes gene_type:complete